MTKNNTDSIMAVETNTVALKEALCAQQRLLQKLYNELDVEREASATAASETLAMILRLQGEKAAVKMEAEHYKRLAEEKMCHAEESMEIFEDLIYQKEMEIASLDYQVQAYRYKLSSLGYEDLGVNEIKFPENLLQRNETLVGETSPESLSRRNSAPPKLLKLACLRRGNPERDRSISPDSDTISKTVEEGAREDECDQNLDSEKPTDGSSSVDINSYWDQIRKLDKIVEDMAGEQYLSLRARSSRSSSVFSQLNELDQFRSLKKSVDDEILSDTCSLSVHDVFEVPQTNETLVTREKQAKDNGKSILKDEKKVGKPVVFPEETMKSYDKEETGLGKKILTLMHKDKQVFFPKDGIIVDCNMTIDLPATDVEDAQGSSQQVNTSQEQVTTTGREVELRLLYDIRDKLDLIQSDIRTVTMKTKKSSPNYDLPMLQLNEAMLHFWL